MRILLKAKTTEFDKVLLKATVNTLLTHTQVGSINEGNKTSSNSVVLTFAFNKIRRFFINLFLLYLQAFF